MVADKVVIETKKSASDAPAVRWESTGSGSYDIRESEKTDAGTEITVFLKENDALYLEEWKISERISLQKISAGLESVQRKTLQREAG
jgi:molecular chaperone HtpG